jgi:hypothetical protein
MNLTSLAGKLNLLFEHRHTGPAKIFRCDISASVHLPNDSDAVNAVDCGGPRLTYFIPIHHE